jgi:hypothetical protein
MKKSSAKYFSFSWIDVGRFLFIFAGLKAFMLLFQVWSAARAATIFVLFFS